MKERILNYWKIKEIENLEELDEFLSKKIKDYKVKNINDFFKYTDNLKDLNKAVDILYENITKKKRIHFICDSDVDGLGTSVLTYRFFKEFIPYGIKLTITNRKEGYGFILKHVTDYDLYVTADNGITSIEATRIAKERGAQVIINDHHQPQEILPEADAIVDPWLDDEFEFKEISGTVVLFIMLRKLLHKFYGNTRDEEWFWASIDMLGLTTISDVMPLDISINRFLVKTFIDNLNNFNKSYHKYLEIFKEFNDAARADDFAFTLIPALNVTNRLTSAVEGFSYLINEDDEKCRLWFQYLLNLNDSRKEKQQVLLEYIEKYYKDWIKDKKFIIIPGQFKEEYKGVLGIIAGRLAEKYKRPAIVMNLKDRVYSGSGRSVGDINILEILKELQEKGLVKNVGGHRGALGVDIEKDKLNEFYIELMKIMNNEERFPEYKFVDKKKPNFYISINNLSIFDVELYKHLEKWEPFGHRFPKPNFATVMKLRDIRVIGKNKNHAILNFTDKNNLIIIKGLWFFFNEEKFKKLENDKEYVVVWLPDIDNWGGNEKLSLRILDVLDFNEIKWHNFRVFLDSFDIKID